MHPQVIVVAASHTRPHCALHVATTSPNPTHIIRVGGLTQPALEALELVIAGVPQRLEGQGRQVAAQAMHGAQRLLGGIGTGTAGLWR